MPSTSKNRTTLLSILEALEKIEKYSHPFDNEDEFYHHELNFDAAMMQFVVIGEMVNKLENSFKEDTSSIPWQK